MDGYDQTPLLPHDPSSRDRESTRPPGMRPAASHLTASHLAASHLAASHLTDAQFTDLLLGAIPPAVTAHLEFCPPCAEEAMRVSGAIASFSQQSRLWAERRAPTLPALQPARQPLLSWTSRPAPWSAAAALVVLAVIVGAGIEGGIVHPPHQSLKATVIQQHDASSSRTELAAVDPASRNAAGSQSADAKLTLLKGNCHPLAVCTHASVATPDVAPAADSKASGIQSDNDLLSAIDGELSADAAPPANMYGLTAATLVSGAKSARRISN